MRDGLPGQEPREELPASVQQEERLGRDPLVEPPTGPAEERPGLELRVGHPASALGQRGFPELQQGRGGRLGSQRGKSRLGSPGS